MKRSETKKSPARSQVASVERALTILELLAEKREGLTTSELSRKARFPKSSTSYLLRTLVSRGYVRRNDSGQHTLGLRLLSLGGLAMQGMELREAALPQLRYVVEHTRLDAHLAILDHGEAVYIERVEGPGFIKMATWVGRRMVPHVTAVGKALISHLDETEVKNLFEQHPIKPITAKTITTLPKLLSELAETRRRGYAIDDEESSERVRCAAAPVMTPNGEVIAAIGISGTVGQISDEHLARIGSVVRTAAMKLSGQLGTRSARLRNS
jgi:DNA-binding IclR family transcriptional regulator